MVAITDCDHDDIELNQRRWRRKDWKRSGLPARQRKISFVSVKGFKSLINQYAPMTEKVFAALSPELKTVVRYGVGVDNVDLAAASRYGVCVCNVPDYGMYEVADQAVALYLWHWLAK